MRPVENVVSTQAAPAQRRTRSDARRLAEQVARVSTLAIVLGGTTMSHADETPIPPELRETTAANPRETRMRALAGLRGKKLPAAQVVAEGLRGLRADDLEAAVRVDLVSNNPDARAVKALLTWLAGVRLASGKEPARLTKQRETLSRALDVVHASPQLDTVIWRFIDSDDDVLVGHAIELAAVNSRVAPAPHVERLVELLSHPTVAVRPALVRMLGATRDRRAIAPLVHAMSVFAEGNPRVGAPEHARALRLLSGARVGDDPAAWRAWLADHR
jgi:hypothetical protein